MKHTNAIKWISVIIIIAVMVLLFGCGKEEASEGQMLTPTPEPQVTQMIAAGAWYVVGLKSDGTVVAVGNNSYGQCNVSSWTGITQVAAGAGHTIGLKSDGTVVAVGWNEYGQCNVSSWTGITQVAAGAGYTVGLKSDGTVVWNESIPTSSPTPIG